MDELTDPDEIEVGTEEPFAVVLSGNAAGGYRWQVAGLPAAIVLRTEDDLPPREPAPGATGTRRFELEAAEPGTFTLRFELRRDWEEGAAGARTVVVHAGG